MNQTVRAQWRGTHVEQQIGVLEQEIHTRTLLIIKERSARVGARANWLRRRIWEHKNRYGQDDAHAAGLFDKLLVTASDFTSADIVFPSVAWQDVCDSLRDYLLSFHLHYLMVLRHVDEQAYDDGLFNGFEQQLTSRLDNATEEWQAIVNRLQPLVRCRRQCDEDLSQGHSAEACRRIAVVLHPARW
ncbi:MAG: hypothetical protein WAS27_04490 [Candidatus Saccharimonadales bacterium]